ncbi:MAG: hypothetical protein ACRYGM_04090 [Janthinobacterium lividum]
MTSLSVRKVQELAAQGRMPGAAKLGSVWTFDPEKVRAWILRAEQAAAARADRPSPAVKLAYVEWSPRPACAVQAAYDRLIKGAPRDRRG